MFRILIADDHPIVRSGLKQILLEARFVRSIEEAATGEEALDKAINGTFDMLLLDISMPGMNGLEVLEALKKVKPAIKVLILSIYPEKDYAVRALKSGASGYLTKKSAPDELLVAIKKMSKGERYISPSLAEYLASHLVEDTQRPLHEILSNREFQVLRMIASGKSLKEIAGEMNLSPKTISTFRTRILEKMQLKNNAELIQYAMKNDLTE